MNLQDFLWQVTQMIEDHCKTVAVDAGARMLAIVRSWYPEVDLEAIGRGYFPKTSDENGHHLIVESIPMVEPLMNKLNVNPHEAPISRASGLVPDPNPQRLEDEVLSDDES